MTIGKNGKALLHGETGSQSNAHPSLSDLAVHVPGLYVELSPGGRAGDVKPRNISPEDVNLTSVPAVDLRSRKTVRGHSARSSNRVSFPVVTMLLPLSRDRDEDQDSQE